MLEPKFPDVPEFEFPDIRIPKFDFSDVGSSIKECAATCQSASTTGVSGRNLAVRVLVAVMRQGAKFDEY
ncbi:34422_t:CDS:2 [Racocetra persica]|uniref:34422_t:CDS:1 n=1 Tax=Racocetra persica TaxID=160502 RepID=A0ACA9MUE4_9GLOM|nr:34422_t:CDS:2 [Racocetra persica]